MASGDTGPVVGGGAVTVAASDGTNWRVGTSK